MSYFKLSNNGIDNAIKDFSSLNNLRRIMSRNDDLFSKYINLGNRTLPNQNPLVSILHHFSVNVEWSPDYLINEISSKAQQLASLVDLTSLYNRGKNHPLSIYPEVNHNTLLVVPFGNPTVSQINDYFSIPLNELVPLYPIYTTDTKQRWDITELIDTKTYKSSKDIFTIINVDIYALVIGFYRWLKRGIEWGNSPHGYLANFPLMNCYLYHNELANYNYLNSNGDAIDIVKGDFNIEPYKVQLTEYTDWKNRYFLSTPMKSFTHFFSINKKTNNFVHVSKMIFPEAYKSLFFVQMSWVWTMASLGMVKKYLEYSNIVGAVDGQMSSALDIYYQKYPLQTQVGQVDQVRSDAWSKHFQELWNTVKVLK